MKPTAEEFLKEKSGYLHDPRAVHHFTGDFVIKIMEEYAALPPPQPVDEGTITIHTTTTDGKHSKTITMGNPPQPVTDWKADSIIQEAFATWIAYAGEEYENLIVHEAFEAGFKASRLQPQTISEREVIKILQQLYVMQCKRKHIALSPYWYSNGDSMKDMIDDAAKAITALQGKEQRGEEAKDKTCETCIWWKKYMLRSQPNTIHLDERFPCNEPLFVRSATFGEQDKKKTKDDSCEQWAFQRESISTSPVSPKKQGDNGKEGE